MVEQILDARTLVSLEEQEKQKQTTTTKNTKHHA